MTEIVKNNSSIKLDILDMGNVGSDQSESEGVFNSLFGGIDAKDNAEGRAAERKKKVNKTKKEQEGES